MNDEVTNDIPKLAKNNLVHRFVILQVQNVLGEHLSERIFNASVHK